jgi:transcription antitermination factor NusG
MLSQQRQEHPMAIALVQRSLLAKKIVLEVKTRKHKSYKSITKGYITIEYTTRKITILRRYDENPFYIGEQVLGKALKL